MSAAADQISRRNFLRGLGLSATGLWLGLQAGSRSIRAEAAGPSVVPADAPDGLRPNVFVHLAPDGRVTIVCHRPEMGQGIRSSLPALLADEMGANLDRVQIVQGDSDKIYGDQHADASNSIRTLHDGTRRAGATARVMLIAAAAARWEVPAAALEAGDHRVIHRPSGRSASFGELAVDAGRQPLPAAANVKFRPNAELRYVGKVLPFVDAPAYVSGTAAYGADVRLPGMLVAAIARPPVLGGRVAGYDRAAALAVPGVRQIVELPHPDPVYGFTPWGGVAVIADHTWAAIRGRDALAVTWDHGAHAGYETEAFRADLARSARAPGLILREVGDVDAGLRSAARTIDVEYYTPHLPHLTMEPPVALARFDPAGGGTCEVWAPTQNPQGVQTEVARALGLPEKRVTIHVTFLGGGFGRKSNADFCSEAALLAKAAGAPVRVQWTRTDDLRNDYLFPVNAQRLTAGLDAGGRVIAWRHRTAFPPYRSATVLGANQPDNRDLQLGILDVPLDVPNVRAEGCKAEPHTRLGFLRAVYHIYHAFAVNTFIDEIAHAKGQDPREAMLEIYGPPRVLTLRELGITAFGMTGSPYTKFPSDAGRLRGVLERATEMARWSDRASHPERGYGLAAHRCASTYVGVVASVRRAADRSLVVDEIWLAADAGFIVNPDRVRAQMEGSVINGMSNLFCGGVTHRHGAVEQSNFDGVGLVRMHNAPRRITVDLLRTEHPSGGVGEPGLPPVAPAVANAIFALTGNRLREFGPAALARAGA